MIGSVNSNTYASQSRDLSKLFGAGSASSTSGSKASDRGAELFSKLDQDQSGGLSATELQTFVDKMSSQTRGALMSVQESAGDSTSSTSSTSSTASDDLFASVDTDGDGSVSQSELKTYMEANRPDGPPPGPPPSEAQVSGSTSTDQRSLFSAIDGDGDGSVTQTELDSFLTEMQQEASGSSETSSTDDTSSTSSTSSSSSSAFDAIDTDESGSISQSELDAYMEANRPEGPPPPPPPQQTASDDSGSTTTSSTSSGSSSSTSSSTSSTTTTANDLAAQLAAAMAEFATKAYGRQSSPDLSSLFSSSIGTVA